MQTTVNEIVFYILELINYPKDKNVFVSEFEILTKQQAFFNIFPTLPEQVQEEIQQGADKDEVLRYVPQDVLLAEYKKTAHIELKNFIEAISPTLTEDQKQKIAELLQQ